MRRAAAIVLGSITGTALLVGAKVGNASMTATAGNDDSGAAVVTGDAGSATPGTTPIPGASAPAPGTPTPQSTTSAGKPATGGPTPTARPTTGAPATGYKDGTYQVSETVAHNFGTLSMTVTVAGGKITDIAASETKSTSYCTRYCPTLRQEALAAQSANIKVLTGQATYTSQAYIAGLKAVLAKA